MRGDVVPVDLPADLNAVPVRRRRRIPHPLRGTQLAYRYRRARRWATATLHARRHNARLAHDAPTLHFFPLRPPPKTQITRILAVLGWRIGFDVDGDGPLIAWDNGTWFEPAAERRLPPGAINGRCLDVSKSTVDRTFAEVAGYSLSVDPLTTEGPLVVKSELNGFHDGQIVEGPLAERREGFVYQRFIDTIRDGVLTTIRTPIVGQHIPVTMLKWRRAPFWFFGTALTEPRPTEDVYSPAEIEHLLRFAAAMGMDYGELDVMRETSSGLIYVVDANRTPVRNPNMDVRNDALIYPPMAEAFRELLPR